MPKSRRRKAQPPRPKLRRVPARYETTSQGSNSAKVFALSAFQKGDRVAALQAIEDALKQSPQDPSLHVQRGVILRASGRVAEAAEAYRTAIELKPNFPAAHNNLGNALRDLGELSASVSHLEQAIRLNTNYPEAHYNLALALIRLDRLKEAETHCEKAATLKQDYAQALTQLARLRARRFDYEGALDAIKQAVQARPNGAEQILECSSILEALGRFDEADNAVSRALELSPDRADVQLALGRRKEQHGDRQGAAAVYRRALAANPDLLPCYTLLAQVGDGLSDEEVRAAERHAMRDDLSGSDRAGLCFALARALEQRGEYDEAFRWARKGNELDKGRSIYVDREAREFVERSMATFHPGFFDGRAPGSASQRPLFIVGFPRSGTTLVEQIIASHPDAAAGGELVEIPDIIRELSPSPSLSYPGCVASLTERDLANLSRRYLDRLSSINDAASRVTDKLPFNFRNLGLIACLFPGARVIHCRRDPRDVAISNYFIRFHRPISFAQSLFDFGQYWRKYTILMRFWEATLPLRILNVDYETVVDQPDVQIRKIIDFAGLSWDDRCLRFFEAQNVVRTASANQIRNPLYSSSIGRWRNYAKHLAPLLHELAQREVIGGIHY